MLRNSNYHIKSILYNTNIRRSNIIQSCTKRQQISYIPSKIGMYDPKNEKDSCGVGMIANLDKIPSRHIVVKAKEMLVRMAHRGGCGCDPNSGDGAGILVGIPHSFFQKQIQMFDKNISIIPDKYAVGNVFFSKKFFKTKNEIENSKKMFNKISKELGFNVIYWRNVPTNSLLLGMDSFESEPHIEQIFIENTLNKSSKDFEKELLRIRSIASRKIRENIQSIEKNNVDETPSFYICSLSNKTITYKGQLTSEQLFNYYTDLQDPLFSSFVALVHSRFSTNTFPSWDRAQPNRIMCHNGEINTLRGNKNWFSAREGNISSLYFNNINDLLPTCSDKLSDSGNFDSVLELLTKASNSNRNLPEAMTMMIPEAWQNDSSIQNTNKKYMYEYQSCLMEPWDGPAMMAFTDGNHFGATLDRNGLRPCRYYITKDNHVLLSSEIGLLPELKHEDILLKKRLEPGKMFLIDFDKGKIIPDEEIKKEMSEKRPFKEWITKNAMYLDNLSNIYKTGIRSLEEEIEATSKISYKLRQENLNRRLNMFGYTTETMDMLLYPMGVNGKEALGSMGNDSPLAVLSSQPKMVYEYFKQLFAQVTNPPIDPIREELVMSLICPVGPESNILCPTIENAKRLFINNPILTYKEIDVLKNIHKLTNNKYSSVVLDSTFPVMDANPEKLIDSINNLCKAAESEINKGKKIIILSDKQAGRHRYAIPSLLALGAVHQHLLKTKKRLNAAIFVESGDAKEVHDFSLLIGFGADGVFPYMAYEALNKMNTDGIITAKTKQSFNSELLYENYKKAVGLGLLKIMSKMGISTLQSYKGAQVFEAVGLGDDIINLCFINTTSRLQGTNFNSLFYDIKRFHESGYPSHSRLIPLLRNPGNYHYRNNDYSEVHFNSPENIISLQKASKQNSKDLFKKYIQLTDDLSSQVTLRGLLKFNYKKNHPIPIEEVESVVKILKRFNTGAMSLGSISKETHETLAEAMNTIGGRSNTGEGGEDQKRHNNPMKRSAIKQVASGRFGVTIEYLSNADQIQIKMAQGAKPGEGGELPGHKVTSYIGEMRHTTPGVNLISPPPHHDIYSIEDLAQLIHDLKNSNPKAEISVKLVSEVGVGVIAAGVTKAYADHITVSGHDGGTGASSWTGIKHGGLPWEMGLAEIQQTLILNNLRSRVKIQTDGQLKTPKDVLVAACLGAEEFGFSTAPLITLGCIMMRKCHLNTCPVGIATQDEELRKKFDGKPEYVINFFYLLAEEIREIMASLGIKKFDDLIGNTDLLCIDESKLHYKSKNLDLSPLLLNSKALLLNNNNSFNRNNKIIETRKTMNQDHSSLNKALDIELIELSEISLNNPYKKTIIKKTIGNINRTVGTMLSNKIVTKFGPKGLPEDTIHIQLNGTGGQSFGFGLIHGVFLELKGDSNDYVGKALSGGKIAIYPPCATINTSSDGRIFQPHENIIVGNACLYGSTSGSAYFSGGAGERFAVRNSGAHAVVENVGAHGCEYMTGGVVVVLGSIGRNFAAGMSGGISFIYDKHKEYINNINKGMVGIENIMDISNDFIQQDEILLKKMIENHIKYTKSIKGKNIVDNWYIEKYNFYKILPHDYKKILIQNKNIQNIY